MYSCYKSMEVMQHEYFQHTVIPFSVQGIVHNGGVLDLEVCEYWANFLIQFKVDGEGHGPNNYKDTKP